MADETPDPEVERLADVIAGEQAHYCGPGYGTCGSVAVSVQDAPDLARAVLADLRERYDLVPKAPKPPCPVCGRTDISTTKSGGMRHHMGNQWSGRWRQVCRGVGQPPTSPEADRD